MRVKKCQERSFLLQEPRCHVLRQRGQASLWQLLAGVERAQYFDQVRQVMAAGQFANRMHGECRQADVHGAHTQMAGGDRADG